MSFTQLLFVLVFLPYFGTSLHYVHVNVADGFEGLVSFVLFVCLL